MVNDLFDEEKNAHTKKETEKKNKKIIIKKIKIISNNNEIIIKMRIIKIEIIKYKKFLLGKNVHNIRGK